MRCALCYSRVAHTDVLFCSACQNMLCAACGLHNDVQDESIICAECERASLAHVSPPCFDCSVCGKEFARQYGVFCYLCKKPACATKCSNAVVAGRWKDADAHLCSACMWSGRICTHRAIAGICEYANCMHILCNLSITMRGVMMCHNHVVKQCGGCKETYPATHRRYIYLRGNNRRVVAMCSDCFTDLYIMFRNLLWIRRCVGTLNDKNLIEHIVVVSNTWLKR